MALLEINNFDSGNGNGADVITHMYAEQCLDEFKGHLYGVEMGICFGGGIEKIGKQWKDRGDVWGFDTFEGHPVEQMLPRDEWAQQSGGRDSMAAVCMDCWYTDDQHRFATQGVDKCSQEYIQSELDKEGLTNVHLVKGLVTEKTDVSFIPYLNYAFLDMDWPQAQWDGYNLIKHKIVKGGYLCLHDMIKPGHIAGCYEKYLDIMAEGLFEHEFELIEPSVIVVLKKK